MSEKVVKVEQPQEESVKTESVLYRFEEMLDSINASIDNAKSVAKEQQELLRIVKAAETEHDFSDFIKGVETQQANINEQVVVLEQRRDTIQQIVDLAKSDAKLEDSISKLAIALGMFN